MKPDYKHLGAKGAEAASLAMGAIRTSAYLSIHQMAAHCEEDTPARTAFARAVIEEYERLRLAEVGEVMPSVEECDDVWRGSKPGTAGIVAVRNLILSAFAKQLEEKDAEIGRLLQVHCSLEDEREVNLFKLAAAEKRLSELEWRPVSMKPTREDADINGCVMTYCKRGHFCTQNVGGALVTETIGWLPFPKPLAPTADEVSRAEFEAWAVKRDYSIRIGTEKDRYADTSTDRAWTVWQAYRASKEVKA